MPITYGKSTGVHVLANGLKPNDSCLRFTPATDRDHLATAFLPTHGEVSLFFSIWIKPSAEDALPLVSIQDGDYNFLARARPVVRRDNGWVLLAGWVNPVRVSRIRFTIESQGRSVSFDKALVIEVAQLAMTSSKRGVAHFESLPKSSR
jgi:hypothetical protein